MLQWMLVLMGLDDPVWNKTLWTLCFELQYHMPVMNATCWMKCARESGKGGSPSRDSSVGSSFTINQLHCRSWHWRGECSRICSRNATPMWRNLQKNTWILGGRPSEVPWRNSSWTSILEDGLCGRNRQFDDKQITVGDKTSTNCILLFRWCEVVLKISSKWSWLLESTLWCKPFWCNYI